MNNRSGNSLSVYCCNAVLSASRVIQQYVHHETDTPSVSPVSAVFLVPVLPKQRCAEYSLLSPYLENPSSFCHLCRATRALHKLTLFASIEIQFALLLLFLVLSHRTLRLYHTLPLYSSTCKQCRVLQYKSRHAVSYRYVPIS